MENNEYLITVDELTDQNTYLEAKIVKLNKAIKEKEYQLQKSKRLSDCLTALLIVLLISVNMNTSLPWKPDNNDRSEVIEMHLTKSGDLENKNALKNIKGRNVDLHIPQDIDATKLVAVENQLLLAEVKTLRKICNQ